MNTDREESRRISYEESPPHRTDRTPGDYAIPQSPFKTPDALAGAMTKFTGNAWTALFDYVGGRGQCQYLAASGLTVQIYIWRDASGGWHPEKKVGANWLPDLDLLDALIEASAPQEFDAEPACGNYTADEVAYMRHPD